MKVVYYSDNNEKLAEYAIPRSEKLNDKFIVQNLTPIKQYQMDVLDRLKPEIFIYRPFKGGKDFYLQYFNHSSFYLENDMNFTVGALLSRTFAREDEDGFTVNAFRHVYDTGEPFDAVVMFLNDNGNLLRFKYLRVVKIKNSIVVKFTDKTEIRTYRDNILKNEHEGVAFYQNDQFVEINDNFAKMVHKSYDDLVGHPIDFKGLTEKSVQSIKEELATSAATGRHTSKFPVEAYEDDKLKYYLNAEFSYTVYQDKPAILIRTTDLTDQEITRMLDDYGEKTDETIKNLTNSKKEIYAPSFNELYIIYKKVPGEFLWTQGLYDVIEDDEHVFELNEDNWDQLVSDEYKERFNKLMDSLSPENPELTSTVPIKTYKGKIKYIRFHVITDYDEEGNLSTFVSTNQNLNEVIEFENFLQNKILKNEAELDHKNELIKEVHRRVKDNLQIILSLIDIDEHFNKDNPEKIINDTKNYINSISIMHQKIYDSATLSSVNLKEYLASLSNSQLELNNSDIKYVLDVDEDLELIINQAIPLGLLLNELIDNTIQHAFPEGQVGSFIIHAHRDENIVKVSYKDEGVGIPDEIDLENHENLGLLVVDTLADQLDSEVEFYNDNGACAKFEFEIESDGFTN